MIKTLFTPKDGGRRPLPPVEAVGGKGYGLYWLAFNRFPAPLTWVLSTAAFDLAIQGAGLTGPVAEIERGLADLAGDWGAIQKRMEELEPYRAQVVDTLQQTAMMDHIAAALKDLPPAEAQWAVRSSATVEDNPRYSFAGQFLSLLSVPRAELWSAICRVWASNYGRDALFYCAQNATPMPRMAVILQPMEPLTARDRAGVAFSRSPVPTLPGVLIQAAFGSGQTVVGGYGGDLFSVQGDRVQVQTTPPDHIRVTGEQGYMVDQAPPSGPALSEEEARQLAGLVLAVAEKWEGAVDIEFVWRAGKRRPTLVQVRSVVEH